jgi:OFA family oxalate/formate antiporter-like MFS transporter
MRNRWLIAAAAVGIHLSIGSIYAWSVLSRPLVEHLGWPLPGVQFTFSLAIAFLGLSAALLGHLVEQRGPRQTGRLAAVLFGTGMVGAGVAVLTGSLYGLYLGYGVLGGMGLGIGYVAPVSTLVKWFPDRRGLATGLAIMGFGFAALIAGPVTQHLLTRLGPASTFFVLGGVYFIVIFASSQYLAPPPPGWVPRGWQGVARTPGQVTTAVRPLTAREAVRTRRFTCLWAMLFINVTCGIAVISVASAMAQESAGMSAAQAAVMVGVMGLFNGGGRLAWAWLSDSIGRPNTYSAFFALQAVLFLALSRTTHPWVFPALVLLIMTCYGGGFACIPAYIADLFGTRHLGAIHGYLLTAWAAAGLAGPLLVVAVRQVWGGYAATMAVFVGLLVLAELVSLWIRRDIARMARPSPTGAPGAATVETFRADLAELPAALAFVAQGAARVGLAPAQASRLQLAVEEATTNVCRHAFLDQLAVNQTSCALQTMATYELHLIETPTALAVELRDAGLPFDPLSVALPDTTAPLAQRQAEGLGLLLLRRMVDDINYTRAGGHNRLTLVMRRSA